MRQGNAPSRATPLIFCEPAVLLAERSPLRMLPSALRPACDRRDANQLVMRNGTRDDCAGTAGRGASRTGSRLLSLPGRAGGPAAAAAADDDGPGPALAARAAAA